MLEQIDIPHDFRSVAGAGHADEQTPARRAEAIRFLGEALRAERRG